MCDSVVATAPHTRSGKTLFGKNSDRRAGECQPFVQFAEAWHPAGSKVRCTHIEIPQVEHTFRVMGHKPWWVFGFEHGVNEHALVIGNQAVFSREAPEEEPGLIGMDLLRLALERSRDRHEAVACITALLEQHGQGGPGFAPDGAGYHNSFNIADPTGACFLETSGRHWVVREVECDGLTNHLCTDTTWERSSDGFEQAVRDAGHWDEEGPVHVERALRNPHIPARLSNGRLARSRALLAKGDGELDVAAVTHLLRDHGEGCAVPPEGLTIEDDAFFTLCVHHDPPGPTTASVITELPTDTTRPWPVWVSFAVPCSGVYLPVYLDATLPAAMAAGSRDESKAPDSLWWIFQRLERAASRDRARFIPWIREQWSGFEAEIEAERIHVEAEAVKCLEAGELDQARDRLTRFVAETTTRAAKIAEEMTWHIAE